MKHVVGVADYKISGTPGDQIITHGLGSCLGIAAYDSAANVGGLFHVMLPVSSVNPEKAKSSPMMFVDTGLPLFFKALYAAGANKERLVVKAAGCGNPLGKSEMFKIGQRNYTLLKKLLWKNGILLESEAIGGTDSRTVYFDIASGMVKINSCGKETPL